MNNELITSYLEAVAIRLDEALGEAVESIFVTGSYALGDFDATTSDLDVIAAVHSAPDLARRECVARLLSHEALPCPAMGLDLTVLRSAVLSDPRIPISYEMALETGARWGTNVFPRGAETELALDLALCRRHGRVLRGPAPAALIAAVPRSWVLRALRLTLQWHRSAVYDPFHDPAGSQAVLNACRAHYYLQNGEFVSKWRAGQWAAGRGNELAAEAMFAHRARTPGPLARAPLVDFLDHVVRRVAAAAAAEQPS